MAWRYGVPSSCQRGFLSDPREHARQGASADNDRGLMIFFPFFFFLSSRSEPGGPRDDDEEGEERRPGRRLSTFLSLSLSHSLVFVFSSSCSRIPRRFFLLVLGMSSHIGRSPKSLVDDREELQFTQLARRGYLIICCPLPMTKRSSAARLSPCLRRFLRCSFLFSFFFFFHRKCNTLIV